MTEKWYITRQTLPELLNSNALRFGTRRAQWWRDGPESTASLNYAELWILIREVAAGLMELGLEKGDRAAVMTHTSPQWIWADYAIICAAGISVSIYPTISAREVLYMVNDSGAKFIFVQDELILERIYEVRPQMSSLQKIILLNGNNRSGHPDVLTFEQLRQLGIGLLAHNRLAFEKRWRSVELTDMMTIVYTSGTTGRQKGVVHSHLSFNAACCRDLRIVPTYRPDDVLLSILPLAHTYERECGHGTATLAAVTIAYSSPQTLLQDLETFKPTVFMSVPRIYERIFMALRETTSGSFLKRGIFKFAMRTGLRLTEARADANGFVDMSEGVDFTRGVGFWLLLKYRIADALVFKKVRARLGGRFRFAFLQQAPCRLISVKCLWPWVCGFMKVMALLKLLILLILTCPTRCFQVPLVPCAMGWRGGLVSSVSGRSGGITTSWNTGITRRQLGRLLPKMVFTKLGILCRHSPMVTFESLTGLKESWCWIPEKMCRQLKSNLFLPCLVILIMLCLLPMKDLLSLL
ncbi:MAG: AMP-binding protein [Firmicutes bacterium]|nr:AMP-binding protein [Bacillota bacterium]